MSESKRRRGRPIGSTIRADEPILRQMADLFLGQPSLRPTSAIKQLVPEWTDTILHRLRGKWKVRKEALLAAARVRRDSASAAAREVRVSSLTIAEALSAQMVRINVDEAIRHVQSMMISDDTLRAIREFQENETVRLARLVENLPDVRLMRELANNPAVEFARSLKQAGLF